MQKTLYVARVGLPSDLSALQDLFVSVADVQSKRLELIPELSKRPFGVFEMSSEEDATACVERFNGYDLNGTQLSVVSGRPRPAAPVAPPLKKSLRKHVR